MLFGAFDIPSGTRQRLSGSALESISGEPAQPLETAKMQTIAAALVTPMTIQTMHPRASGYCAAE
jgi:hypothetical protein